MGWQTVTLKFGTTGLCGLVSELRRLPAYTYTVAFIRMLRDSVLPILCPLSAMAKTGRPLAEIAADFRFLAGARGIAEIDNRDGVRITVSNGEVVHFRASGKAPELRRYVEARADRARTNCSIGASALAGLKSWKAEV
ncbi:hypothetical protein EN873_01985 [bacterium M00.F.Ca.ET.230.01.1.1]|nr:hypothetical protein EN873_01985 [bacterium M00.F.Ca.ET.230.01.1.1]